MFEHYWSVLCSAVILIGMIITFFYHSKIYFGIRKKRKESIGAFEFSKLKNERELIFTTDSEINMMRKKYRYGILIVVLGFLLQIIYWMFTAQ